MPSCQNLANCNWIRKDIRKMAYPIKLCPDPHIRHKLVSRVLALKMAAKFEIHRKNDENKFFETENNLMQDNNT